MKLKITPLILALLMFTLSSFLLKNITASIAGKSGGPITKSELQAATELQLDNDAYEIIGFNLNCLTEIDGRSDLVELASESNAFTPEMIELFGKVNAGDKLYVERITALKGSKEVELEALEFTIQE